MKQVIVFPRGQLSALDRARLEEHGIVAIEADDPSKIVTVIPGAPLASADDMLIAALEGLTAAGTKDAWVGFGKELKNRICPRDKANKVQGHD